MVPPRGAGERVRSDRRSSVSPSLLPLRDPGPIGRVARNSRRGAPAPPARKGAGNRLHLWWGGVQLEKPFDRVADHVVQELPRAVGRRAAVAQDLLEMFGGRPRLPL